jgi:cytochrome c
MYYRPRGRSPASRWLPALTLLFFGATASADESAEGQVAFNTHCRTCHSVDEGDNRLGPNLHNIVGKKAGTAEGFSNYSQSLVESGLTWDEKTLDRFLASPEKVVPNNSMKPYQGIADEAARQSIIDYLKSESE